MTQPPSMLPPRPQFPFPQASTRRIERGQSCCSCLRRLLAAHSPSPPSSVEVVDVGGILRARASVRRGVSSSSLPSCPRCRHGMPAVDFSRRLRQVQAPSSFAVRFERAGDACSSSCPSAVLVDFLPLVRRHPSPPFTCVPEPRCRHHRRRVSIAGEGFRCCPCRRVLALSPTRRWCRCSAAAVSVVVASCQWAFIAVSASPNSPSRSPAPSNAVVVVLAHLHRRWRCTTRAGDGVVVVIDCSVSCASVFHRRRLQGLSSPSPQSPSPIPASQHPLVVLVSTIGVDDAGRVREIASSMRIASSVMSPSAILVDNACRGGRGSEWRWWRDASSSREYERSSTLHARRQQTRAAQGIGGHVPSISQRSRSQDDGMFRKRRAGDRRESSLLVEGRVGGEGTRRGRERQFGGERQRCGVLFS